MSLSIVHLNIEMQPHVNGRENRPKPTFVDGEVI